MTNSEHSTLTGASLHEPKGVAAASASRVYVSDGAGSGNWSTVPIAALASTSKAFQAQLLQVQEEQTTAVVSSTTNAGGSGDYHTVALNTSKTNEITSATLTTNVVSLPAGTYYAKATMPINFGSASTAKLRLRDTTNSVTLVLGPAVQDITGTGSSYPLTLEGRFTLAGTANVSLQYAYQAAVACSFPTYGHAFGTGDTEVYGQLWVWKVT